MAESTIEYIATTPSFHGRDALAAALAPILRDEFWVDHPEVAAQRMARAARESEDEHFASWQLGQFVVGLVLAAPHTYVPTIEPTNPSVVVRARELSESLRAAPGVELLTNWAGLTTRVAGHEEMAQVLDAMFAHVPLVDEVALPEGYLNPPAVWGRDSLLTGRVVDEEMLRVRRFQIRRGGNAAEYAAMLLERDTDTVEHLGRHSVYRTRDGLTAFVTASPAEDGGAGYDVQISLMRVRNPLILIHRPLTSGQLTTAGTMLNDLQAALQDLDF